jgi:hypothetical protein
VGSPPAPAEPVVVEPDVVDPEVVEPVAELVLGRLPAYPPSGGPPRSTVSPQAEAARIRRIACPVLKDVMVAFNAS